ncbi:MAG TPA: TROVE domain-containing protein [Verrucomicrobiae bacterium]
MALNYAKLFNRRVTPQSRPIPGSTQVANSGGGYSWQVDDWTRFDRFLILGAEGGTYYITERDLVKQNHDAIVRCIKLDGIRAVKRIVEISDSGRAPKNDPAVFALALVAAHGSPEAKALAFQNLAKVCRIGTHLFHFAEYVNALRGWGRGLRNAVGRWYLEQEADKLAYQVVKYQQRDSWSHGDLLRLAHSYGPGFFSSIMKSTTSFQVLSGMCGSAATIYARAICRFTAPICADSDCACSSLRAVFLSAVPRLFCSPVSVSSE